MANDWQQLIAELLNIPNILGVADRGDYLEAALLHTHYDYLERQEGFVAKLGVPVRGKGRFSRPFHAAKTLCDFVGWVVVEKPYGKWNVYLKEGFAEEKHRAAAQDLSNVVRSPVYMPDGELLTSPDSGSVIVPIAFDAKRRDISKGSGWRWQCSQVPKHQRLALQMVEGWLGGWGFFLVSLESGGILLHDVRVVRASLLQPGTSVDLSDCPSVELGLRGCDWLPVVEELFENGL